MPGGVHPPLDVIFSWPKPNYAHPESAGNGIVVVSLFLTSVATTLVSLRLYSRICLIHQPGLDDMLIVVGLVRHAVFFQAHVPDNAAALCHSLDGLGSCRVLSLWSRNSYMGHKGG